MNGLELITAAMERKKVERIPWVPFVGAHAGQLLVVDATTYFKSERHIVDGAEIAIKKYRPDGIPVTFDLQIEAEVLGCTLKWSEENPPAVISHPLGEGVLQLEDLKVPCRCKGRIGTVMNAAAMIRERHPDIALYGLITGPFTLALHLLGTDIFMKLFEDPDYVGRLMDFCKQVGEAMSKYYTEAGCDVIAVVDPMVSQIDPMSFEMFVAPYCKELFKHIGECGALSSFFVCGNATQNIEEMCKCGPDNISVDENIPLDYLKEHAETYEVSFGGNMKLTSVLLMGTPEDSKFEALECMDIGGNTGFILAPGCDLPMATPEENLVAVGEIVHDTYQQDVLRAKGKTTKELELLNLKEYFSPDKVIVDVITLDSASCAPCQYMVKAVELAVTELESDRVEYVEHKIKNQEGIQMMMSLGVKNLPTICIDGKAEFISKIPPKTELMACIQEHLDQK
ncbi:MAG: uroporphyrinogen decarboxylase family protein [Bacteroidota bacterium]